MRELKRYWLLIVGSVFLGGFTTVMDAQTVGERPGVPQNVGPDTLAWKRYPIEGYASKTSVVQGGSIDLMVAAGDTAVSGRSVLLEVYRSGAIDSLYATLGPYTLQFQPLHDSTGAAIFPSDPQRFHRHPKDYKTGCSWPVTRSLSVPATWKSGFYYVKASLPDAPSVSRRFPFVVRQAAPGSTSKTLYKVAMSEYHAYSCWGGGNYYWWTNPTLDMTDTLSLLRPLGNNINLDSRNDLGSFLDYEQEFIRWAEGAGYTMEYCTNIDLDVDGDPANPERFAFVSSYQCLMIGGHDEYCSRPERSAVEGQLIRSLGHNAAFLSANMFYWRVRYDNGLTRMICNKADTSNLWRNTFPEGPEAGFIGVQYEQGYNQAPAIDTVRLSSHWLFRGTGLATGGAFGFGSGGRGILAAEVDHRYPSSPWNVDVLTSAWVDSTIIGDSTIVTEDTTLSVPIYGRVLHESTFYIDTTSNSRVFAGGAQRWGSGVFGRDSVAFRTYATNMMDHFSGGKYIGNVYTVLPRFVEWGNNIQLDGDVVVLPGRYLKLMSCTATVDSVLFVDGTCEINGGVGITGNGSLNINPGGRLVLKAGSTLTVAPSAYFVLEAGGEVEFESGSKLVLNRGTIEAGATLTVGTEGSLEVTPGGQIAFGDSAALVAYGPLTAHGTSSEPVTFGKLASSGGWLGIYVESGLSVTELRHCAVSDAVTGVTANSSRFLLKESTVADCEVGVDLSGSHAKWYYHIDTTLIENCSTAGVVLGDASNVLMRDDTVTGCGTGVVTTQGTSVHYRNVIENSTYHGVIAGEYSNPRFGDIVVGVPGNNVIRGNGSYAVQAETSTPFLGLGSPAAAGGYNSITGEGILVNAGDGAGVTAQLDWWGKYPPESWQFESDWTSNIDYGCALTYDPNEGTGPVARIVPVRNVEATEEPLVGSPLTPEGTLLREAVARRARGKAEDAIPLYAGLVRSRPDAPEARVAVQELRNTFHDLIRDPRDSSYHRVVLDSMVVYGERHPNPGLRRLARGLAAQEHGHLGDFGGSLAGYRQILESAGSDKERLTSLFALFTVSTDGLHDREMAAGFLAQLTSRYPSDIRTRVAAAKLEAMPDRSRATVPAGSGLLAKAEAKTTRPQEFRLEQNYPNPFNPSTVLAYEIPPGRGGGEVPAELAVYDLLGRKVAVLASGLHAPGRYEVRWEAGERASGVYLARLESAGRSVTKTLMLVK